MNIHYNVREIQRMLKYIHEFIRTPITVYDDKFNYVTDYSWFPEHSTSGICKYCQVVRSNDENPERCKLSDSESCARCQASGKRESYLCYAGLYETVMPIHYRNMLLGYIMFGEYRLVGEGIDIEDYAKRLGVDSERLKSAYEEVSVLTPSQVEAASELIAGCSIQFCATDAIFYRENERAEYIKRYIDDNIHKVTVNDVCNSFFISRRQLYNIFRSNYGSTVKQYILNKRIENAKHLLLTSTKTVTEIAEEVGFADYNNFIQRFKQLMGVTPQVWRKRS